MSITPPAQHIDAVITLNLIEADTDGLWECECEGGWECECEAYDLQGYDMDRELRDQAVEFIEDDFDEALLAELLTRAAAVEAAAGDEAERLRTEGRDYIWERVYQQRAIRKGESALAA